MKYLLLFFPFFLSSCNNSNLQAELASAQSELEVAKKTIIELQQNNSNQLVHIVFLKLKSDTNRKLVIEEIKKLESIEVVKEMAVGYFRELGDQRALFQYELAFQVCLADSIAYQTYQQHPIHLKLKERLKESLAGSPVTYDFVVE